MNKIVALVLLSWLLTGCVGAIVGTAVDVTIEAAKVPFKVGGAVIDVMSDDDDEDEED